MAAAKELKAIKLYVAATMNGWKIPILLEELKLPYSVYHIDFSKKEQKEAWYLKINPNGRIPAIVDPNNDDFALAESAAILMYLCQKYDPENKRKLFAKPGCNEYYKITQWLYFQMSAIGPIMGNSMYFNRLAVPKGLVDKDHFSVKRFQDESKRLLSVLDTQLQSYQYITGSQYTIADICHYPWIKSAYWANVSLDPYKNVKKWINIIDKREAVIKGITIPKANRQFFGDGDEQQIKDAIKANADNFDLVKKEKDPSDKKEDK